MALSRFPGFTFQSFFFSSFLFLSFLFQGLEVSACTCPPPELVSKKQTDAYSAIFRGKVDSVSTCKDELSKAWITVHQLFKGDVTQHITVTFDCATDCRVQMKAGEDWLIYARSIKYGDLRVEFCSRSRKYVSDMNEDYSIATNAMTWQDEIAFLKSTYGEQATGEDKEVIDPRLTNHELIKPQGMQIIWLLLGSLGVMGVIWLLIKKFWK